MPTGLTRLLCLGVAEPQPIRGEHSGEFSSGGSDTNPPPFYLKFDWVRSRASASAFAHWWVLQIAASTRTWV